jgi:uncharacterized membrane protein
MEHTVDWISLVLRWAHIITGAAWIGTSFYFNWLNNHVRPVEEKDAEETEEGVSGELWSIHGGHFYRVVKYKVAPPKLPKVLHWFKYEAYFTWITGICLLVVVYYLDTSKYLVDERIEIMPAWQGIAIGLGTIAAAWVVYHYTLKTPLKRQPVVIALIGFAAATGIGYFLTTMFGSRAAYMHMGALLGTIMAANVFFVIIPNQRAMVNAMIAGKAPEAQKGIDAAQRSLHNNYLTLPVLFIMVSNHYPFTFGHEWNWALLAGISIVGAGVRHWFNLRGLGRRNVWILPAASIAIVALAFVSAPKSYADYPPVAFSRVREIIDARCIQCHSATPSHPAFPTPPQGIAFDTPAQVVNLAARINSVSVASQTMPLGNLTNMTEEERDEIGAWVFQGAKSQ